MAEGEDRICALCEWGREAKDNFFCGHKDQKDEALKAGVRYNDGCGLFEERLDRKGMYDFLDGKQA